MLKIGVIGCGGMGRNHIERITNRIQGAEVVAVADTFEENAKLGAEIAGCSKIYSEGKDLIHDPEVEAVLVVSPGFLHCGDVLEAISVGKRVFCEKPLCTTAEDCKKIMDAEIASGKHLVQVGFCRRYYVGYNQLKKEIATGKYGEPLMIHMTHRAQSVALSYDTPMAVNDTCIHDLDLCHWLTGEEYDSVQVVFPKETKNTHENLRDPQFMMLRTKSGVLIDVEVNVNCKFGYDINMEVVCEDASLKMGMPIAPQIKYDAQLSRSITTDHFELFKQTYDDEIQDWVDHAEAGVIHGPSTWDGYFAAVTVDTLVKAQQTGQIEKVVAVEKPDFYK